MIEVTTVYQCLDCKYKSLNKYDLVTHVKEVHREKLESVLYANFVKAGTVQW